MGLHSFLTLIKSELIDFIQSKKNIFDEPVPDIEVSILEPKQHSKPCPIPLPQQD